MNEARALRLRGNIAVATIVAEAFRSLQGEALSGHLMETMAESADAVRCDVPPAQAKSATWQLGKSGDIAVDDDTKETLSKIQDTLNRMPPELVDYANNPRIQILGSTTFGVPRNDLFAKNGDIVGIADPATNQIFLDPTMGSWRAHIVPIHEIGHMVDYHLKGGVGGIADTQEGLSAWQSAVKRFDGIRRRDPHPDGNWLYWNQFSHYAKNQREAFAEAFAFIYRGNEYPEWKRRGFARAFKPMIQWVEEVLDRNSIPHPPVPKLPR